MIPWLASQCLKLLTFVFILASNSPQLKFFGVRQLVVGLICNIDGVASGFPLLVACGGLFQDENAHHLLSFSVFLDVGTLVLAESMAAILAIEKAK